MKLRLWDVVTLMYDKEIVGLARQIRPWSDKALDLDKTLDLDGAGVTTTKRSTPIICYVNQYLHE